MNNLSIKQFLNEYPYVPYAIAIGIVLIFVIVTILITYQRKYKITFMLGEEVLEKRKAKKGSYLDLPVLEDADKTFDGWYFDQEFTKKAYLYTFPKQNVVLYAKFNIDEEASTLDNILEPVVDSTPLAVCEEIAEDNTVDAAMVDETSLDTFIMDTIDDSTDEVAYQEVMVESNIDSLDIYNEDSIVEKTYSNFITLIKNSSVKNHKKFQDLANEILKYRKVSYRYTKKECIFRYLGNTLVRISFAGDNLKIYLALDFNNYIDINVKMRDVSDTKKYSDTPLMLNLKTDKATNFTLNTLLPDLAVKYDLKLKRGYKVQSYNRLVLALKDSPLVKKNREDLLCEKINVLDVDVLNDEDAKGMLTYKNGILGTNIKNVQLNVLEDNFTPGSLIDLRRLIAKNIVSEDTDGFKLIGKGTLTKSFTIVCDDVSMSALKMVLLTGGKLVLITEEV